jgi:hypothetical protein
MGTNPKTGATILLEREAYVRGRLDSNPNLNPNLNPDSVRKTATSLYPIPQRPREVTTKNGLLVFRLRDGQLEVRSISVPGNHFAASLFTTTKLDDYRRSYTGSYGEFADLLETIASVYRNPTEDAL